MIRDYQDSDFAACSVLLKQLVDESQYSDFEYSDKDLYSTIAMNATNKDNYLKVAEVDGLVVGFLSGGVYKNGFSSVMVGTDFAMYMHPDFRKGGGGASLIRDFTTWCKDNGANETRIGISYGFESTDHKLIKRLMTGLKFKPSGEWFRRIH